MAPGPDTAQSTLAYTKLLALASALPLGPKRERLVVEGLAPCLVLVPHCRAILKRPTMC